MILIRILLQRIRELSSKPTKYTLNTMAVVILLISIITGVIIDILLPFNVYINTIRGVIALISGLSAFVFAYNLSVARMRLMLKRSPDYKMIRKRFTRRERINMSAIGGILLFTLVILGAKPSPVYTLISSFVITSSLVILSFSRTYREEYTKISGGMPDVRDLAHYERRDNNLKVLKQRREERAGRGLKKKHREEQELQDLDEYEGDID